MVPLQYSSRFFELKQNFVVFGVPKKCTQLTSLEFVSKSSQEFADVPWDTKQRKKNLMGTNHIVKIIFGQNYHIVLELNICVPEMLRYDFGVYWIMKMIWMMM